jgi:hypothetical protein
MRDNMGEGKMSKNYETKVHYSNDNKQTACFIEDRRPKGSKAIVKVSTNRELINCGTCWKNIGNKTVSFTSNDTIREI